jgi:hypothetical protein
MKVLVTGGRDYSMREQLERVLSKLHAEHKFTHLIHGGAKGADTLADTWARHNGVQPVRCDALWQWHRQQGAYKRAGYERNRAMLALEPDIVVAFPGGNGTRSMVTLAEEALVRVIKVKDKRETLA